uniref:uncharacterized protein LOC117609750 n=1 Tax=Osmia lignaria TaxID=473952 RepID=UPI0014786D58|nr:uncharacterized protein LOC117609750 [Osmia lignaria]XP_034192287.1 uncharacterized protein LOC117609750 [Osmia lignaria]
MLCKGSRRLPLGKFRRYVGFNTKNQFMRGKPVFSCTEVLYEKNEKTYPIVPIRLCAIVLEIINKTTVCPMKNIPDNLRSTTRLRWNYNFTNTQETVNEVTISLGIPANLSTLPGLSAKAFHNINPRTMQACTHARWALFR